MTDTVNRLMSAADRYAATYRVYFCQTDKNNTDIAEARQALEDELRTLLTPLSDGMMDAITLEASKQLQDCCAGVREELPLSVGRLVEQAHGMGTVVTQPIPLLRSTTVEMYLRNLQT